MTLTMCLSNGRGYQNIRPVGVSSLRGHRRRRRPDDGEREAARAPRPARGRPVRRHVGDPGRDPRMNVVTVAYVAVIRDIGTPAASTDAAAAALVPVEEALSWRVPLAFDHATILGDAVDRVRADLELTGTATAFLPPAFTLAELRSVYEAVWNVHFDAANFRKRVLAEEGWVIPTGRRARPGAAGGKPPELFRAGRRWKHGSPVRRRRPA